MQNLLPFSKNFLRNPKLYILKKFIENMDIIKIEVLLVLLLFTGIGLYYKGTKDNSRLLKTIGKRLTIITGILTIFQAYMILR